MNSSKYTKNGPSILASACLVSRKLQLQYFFPVYDSAAAALAKAEFKIESNPKPKHKPNPNPNNDEV